MLARKNEFEVGDEVSWWKSSQLARGVVTSKGAGFLFVRLEGDVHSTGLPAGELQLIRRADPMATDEQAWDAVRGTGTRRSWSGD